MTFVKNIQKLNYKIYNNYNAVCKFWAEKQKQNKIRKEEKKALRKQYNKLVETYEYAKIMCSKAKDDITCRYVINKQVFACDTSVEKYMWVKNERLDYDESKAGCINIVHVSSVLWIDPENSGGPGNETINYCHNFGKDFSECKNCRYAEDYKKYKQANDYMKLCEAEKEKFWNEKNCNKNR